MSCSARHCLQAIINFVGDYPIQVGRSQKYDPRAAAISKFGLDNLAPCSRFFFFWLTPFRLGPSPSFGRKEVYLTLPTRPNHLSEHIYPAWGIATRDLCLCGTSAGPQPSQPSQTASWTSPDKLRRTGQFCATKIRQDSCLRQDYSRLSPPGDQYLHTSLVFRRRQDKTDCSASHTHDSPIDIKGFDDGTLQSASYAKVSQAL